MIAGRYSLEREIGRGGMGAVWLGRDSVLGRPVALKRIGLLPGADRTDLARAEREARLSASLNHPHVVAIFDIVVDAESDAHWLVMEYVEGSTLAQLVRDEGPLAPDAAAPMLRQSADALAAAHAAGIVHRDVKPSNILVDRRRQVKLTDFGIARIATDATLTQTGLITGSPAYLAPELATGGRGDQAADVWSLGATAFHVLSGRPPYPVGDNVLSTLYRIVNEEPPRLPGAGWMAPLLAATLVRDPEQRWPMARVRDFLADPANRREGTAQTRPVLPPVPTAPARDPDGETTSVQPLVTAGSAPLVAGEAATPPSSPGAAETPPPRRRLSPRVLLGAGVGLAVLLALVLFLALRGGDPETQGPTAASPSSSPSPSEEAGPTAEGIEAFIRDYVAAVGEDPARSWQMLTPKFQEESGGFTQYRNFWDAATNGRVLSISTNPDNLSVSYQVRFDNFDNGPGPTVLDLTYEDGTYRIDGERSEGFQPAG